MTQDIFDKVLKNIESDISAYNSSGISVCKDIANNRVIIWDMCGNNPMQVKYDYRAFNAFLSTLKDRYELTETDVNRLGSSHSYKFEIHVKQNNVKTL